MADITLRGLGHSYLPNPRDEGDYALKPVDLTWQDGKTYALLGPSGCGKTTMLNLISGLLMPSTGQILFDGQDMSRAKTVERNIAQVFQFPVIYTTKTVRQNLAFPLECRNWPSDKIRARVEQIAELLELTDRLDAPTRGLSADQKQIISLGRGLVRDDVNAILLDEPLTVIDPQMKSGLRHKLRAINRATGTTMILVTHDQSEAMSFADEVIVMQDGRVQQAGTPEALFARPSNAFVGYFIGSPPLNMLTARQDGALLLCPALGQTREVSVTGPCQFGIRPEHIRLSDTGVAVRVHGIENRGLERILTLETTEGEHLKVKTRAETRVDIGARVMISAQPEDLLLFADGQLVG